MIEPQLLAPFDLAVPSRILFGRGKASIAKELIPNFGKRIVLVHGANPDRAKWLIDDLSSADVELHTIGCHGEPDLLQLESALFLARAFGPDCVVALGGGAALDLGKAIAGLVPEENPVTHYLEVVGKGLPLENTPLPFVAMPTTAGTGSEVTKNAVIGIAEHSRKVSLRDTGMIANLVIVDPALSDNCPKHVTLSSGLDAITQLIEPFICNKANPFTDSLCLNALPPALSAIRVLMERGENFAARDAMAWASLCSGIALANAGLGAVHGLAGVIGGTTGAPHGEICASLLPAALEANLRAMRQAGKDTRRIELVADMIAEAFDVAQDQAFSALATWSRKEGIRSIVELGLSEDNFESVANAAPGSSSMRANPADLQIQDLVGLLKAA